MIRIQSSSSPLMIGLAGGLVMAAAMGFGRFFYTPVLPGMMSGIPLSAADAGLIAAGNFAGYLCGALLASQGWATGFERKLALGGLLATALLLVAMATTTWLPAFILIRFCAGLASAFAMIFTSSIVLAHGAGRASVGALHFGGVGAGIAASSVLALIINIQSAGPSDGWRVNWLAGAAVVMLVLFFVARLLPQPVTTRSAEAEPPIRWTRPLVLMTASYGLFGFGYVVTATFLVAIARMANAGPVVEAGSWFVTGITAAVSLFIWQPFVNRFGLVRSYLACLLLEALGVLASVYLPPIFGTLVGGLSLGVTFMTVTSHGLQVARALAPASARKVLALMTAAFGVGQIFGPLVAGWATQWSGSFTLASVIAAMVLLLAFVLALPVVSAFEPLRGR
ncbi:MFS transporter [Rhizobium sp. Root149]|jgi:MFS family permease|uniref:YbfB/YjiJ family MFS transporter n=1 Tax=Rhizobium sp. Root149 TaxID=1736473 RepID=UPI00071572A8|nr:YbfB/YjiJ family MFS transporter [Rhizobium sp. Root149]KQZ54483.1 MFS transporter [Rhizobium sp. Root149]